MPRQRSIRSSIPFFVLFLCEWGNHQSTATTTTCAFVVQHQASLLASRSSSSLCKSILRAKQDDNEEDKKQVGMEEAFRQLEALESLGDDAAPPSIPNDKKTPLTTPPDLQQLTATTTTDADISLESEMKVYEDMVGELQVNEEAEAYRDVLGALGSRQQITQTDDTYANVMEELGGTPRDVLKQPPPTGEEEGEQLEIETILPSTVASDELEQIRSEKFMEEALQEAMKDVKLKDSTLSDSILDDTEIMKEIEQIFEEGNDKLLESLEEIRTEQVRVQDQKSCCWIKVIVGTKGDMVKLCVHQLELVHL